MRTLQVGDRLPPDLDVLGDAERRVIGRWSPRADGDQLA